MPEDPLAQLEIHPEQPISYSLGTRLADNAERLQAKTAQHQWRTDSEGHIAHIDALMTFAFQAVNSIRMLELEIAELKSQK